MQVEHRLQAGSYIGRGIGRGKAQSPGMTGTELAGKVREFAPTADHRDVGYFLKTPTAGAHPRRSRRDDRAPRIRALAIDPCRSLLAGDFGGCRSNIACKQAPTSGRRGIGRGKAQSPGMTGTELAGKVREFAPTCRSS